MQGRRCLCKVAHSYDADEAHVAEYVIAGWIINADDDPPRVPVSKRRGLYALSFPFFVILP